MARCSVVMTTVGSEEDARRLAGTLVELRLAACVSIIPEVSSVYNWKGAVQQEREWLLLIKTRADRIARIRSHFAASHPYELPELVALPVGGGSPAYLRWVASWLDGGKERGKERGKARGRGSG